MVLFLLLQVRGLCGFYNNKIADDFTKIDKMITSDIIAFAQSYAKVLNCVPPADDEFDDKTSNCLYQSLYELVQHVAPSIAYLDEQKKRLRNNV